MIVSSRIDVQLLAKLSEFLERALNRRIMSRSSIVVHSLETLVAILEQNGEYLQDFTVQQATDYFDSIGLPCRDTLSSNEQRALSETRDEELPSLEAVREVAKRILENPIAVPGSQSDLPRSD